MRSSIGAGAAIALALVAGVFAMRCDRGAAPPLEEPPPVRADAASPHVADDTTPPTAERTEAPGQRSQQALDAVRATTPTLRVRLLGLDDAVPWTTAVSLEIDGEDETGRAVDHSAEARPDAEGRMWFAVPDWAATRMTKGRLDASDPAYLRLRERWRGGQDVGEELLVRVYRPGTVTGRVVDEQGRPMKAQVTASVPRDAGAFWGSNPLTKTRADGTWSLKVPAAAGLKISAEATQGSEASSLLEASAVVQVRAGPATEVPDLVLARASFVTGSVRWLDGEPVAGANIWLRQVDGQVFADGGTDSQGRFTLPARPGCAVDVLIAPSGLVAQAESRRTMPGQEVEVRLLRPVVVRARRGGDYVDSHVEFGAGSDFFHFPREAAHTELVAPTREIRLRAVADRWRSAWRTIGPADAGKTIDLELVTKLTEVLIHLDSEVAVFAAESRWRRTNGERDNDVLRRSTRDEPFRVLIEPGSYHVTVEATADHKAGEFLLPLEGDVDVAGEQTTVRLSAAFGGRLELTATGADGAPIAARCVIAGNRARAVQEVELNAERGGVWSGVLPAGAYDLYFDVAGHGKRQRTVTIVPRKLARICVRL